MSSHISSKYNIAMQEFTNLSAGNDRIFESTSIGVAA